MDDDWDLHAVVRGCATAHTPTPTPTTTTTTISNSNDNPFSCSFPLPNFHNDNNSSFDFPGDLIYDTHDDPFQDLQDICQGFFLDPTPPATTNMSTSIPVISQLSQPHYESVHIQPPAPQMDIQTQQNIQFKNPTQGSPATNSQHIRPQRRRKNQHVQKVCQMTEEELSVGSWAWKKYGQKVIKGSPYPRNYYRCNTAKGCAARKHVERSSNNPVTFSVTYIGDHTHSRPTHWTGTTRNNLSANNPSTSTSTTLSLQKRSFSSSPLVEADKTDGAQNADFMNADDNIFGGLSSSGVLSLPSWIATSSASITTTFNGEGSG